MLAVEFETAEAHVAYPGAHRPHSDQPVRGGTEGRKLQKPLYWFPNKETDLAQIMKEKSNRESTAPVPAPVEIHVENRELHGRADERSMVATGLVVFALVFFLGVPAACPHV